MKKIKIRKFNWKIDIKEGIPLDALQIMIFFNKGLKNRKYPYVPRTNKITKKEIKAIWVKTKDEKISFVAEIDKKIVGAGTIFLNAHNKEGKKVPNHISLTLDPKYFGLGIGIKLLKSLVKEGKKNKIKFLGHVDCQNQSMLKIIEKLGYSPIKKIRDKKRKLNRFVFEFP